MTSCLHFAAVDLIFDRSRTWRVLEVNDHPLGLVEADRIAALAKNSIFNADATKSLATFLSRKAGLLDVALLLPECFRVVGPKQPTYFIAEAEKSPTADSRIKISICEFNTLASWVRRSGTACWITDILGIEQTVDGQIFVAGSQQIGALFRRSSRFPPVATDVCTVNDIRCRIVCADKLKTFKLLSRSIDSRHLIESVRLDSLAQNLSRIKEESKFVVTKPGMASSSVGVERRPISEFVADPSRALSGHNHLVQPWIESEALVLNDRNYQWDVRVYLLEGEPVAGMLRYACAAADGIAAASPLAWLTTGGGRLPLTVTRSLNENHVPSMFSQDDIMSLLAVCRDVIQTLDVATDNLSTDSFSDVPSFSEANGLHGEVEPIFVKAISRKDQMARDTDEVYQ